ncbi:hypothetical protein [Mesorhizobium sp.]|uniref:hypothetical protein n=1 Tax=Mesorhizobium sp. TaxID=1871066 RepID=UPI0012006C75|nr:hypothetical protein [Mesorhizobium sp.]TIM06775.1 MAG: hypothetical protein E5Y62_22305 [Mesorhizobium sp.]
MSDDFHRPTYTTKDPHGAFNATQVRLYGIPGLGIPLPNKKTKTLEPITGQYKNYSVIIAKIFEDGKPDDPRILRFKKYLTKTTPDKSSYVFVNSIVKRFMLMLGAIDINPAKADEELLSSGVIFGYAYEGHTYDLPKPKVMLIPAYPEAGIPNDDSNYKSKESEGYAVWIVDKLDKCVEIEVNQGFIEQIVLDANLPGKRSPTMYASRMMMGHRGGRLGD